MFHKMKLIYMRIVLVAAVGGAVFLLSRTKFEIKHEIDINASPAEVWQAITDFENYKRWNSQLAYLGGAVKPGGRLHLKLTADGAGPYEFKPTISYWEESRKFAWLAITGARGVFDGEHFFELRDTGNGKTRLINREEYRGILSQMIRRLPMMKKAPQGFEKMNRELKAFVEAGYLQKLAPGSEQG
jgi:hypothetical protein